MDNSRLLVRPAVRSDESAVLELARQAFSGAASPWTSIDAWETGWVELLRSFRVSVLEAPDPFGQGRRYEAEGEGSGGRSYGSGVWAVVAARKSPAIVSGWRVDVEILAAPSLGPSHLRQCELEASRLARALSARKVQLRWFPGGTAGREDRLVKIARAA